MFRKIMYSAMVGGVSTTVIYKNIHLLPDSELKYQLQGSLTSGANFFKISNLIFVSGLDYYYHLKYIDNIDQEEELRKFYQRLGERIYNVCSSSKGIMVKFGQHISNFDRMIPNEIIVELRKLQDQVKGYDKQNIEWILKNELKENYNKIKNLEDLPLGSASLAQVHKGQLIDGSEIAVKVQYPELKTQFPLDLVLIGLFNKLLTKGFKYLKNDNYDFEVIYNKFKHSLLDEIDFTKEAQNSIITKELFKDVDYVKIPDVYLDMSNQRVLIMEYVNAVNIDENEKIQALGLDLKEVSEKLIKVYSQMIFENGHVHCDAHAGNILVRRGKNKQCQIVLLDHGFYQTYPQSFSKSIRELWIALITQDHKRMKSAAVNIGLGNHYQLLPLVFLYKSRESKTIGENISRKNISKVANQKDFSFEKVHEFIKAFPEEFILALRALNLIAVRNASLGGTTRERLFLMTEVVYGIQYQNFIQRYYKLTLLKIKVFLFENFFSIYQKLFFIDKNIIQLIIMNQLLYTTHDFKGEIESVTAQISSDILNEIDSQKFNCTCKIQGDKIIADFDFQQINALQINNNMMMAKFFIQLKNQQTVQKNQLFFIDTKPQFNIILANQNFFLNYLIQSSSMIIYFCLLFPTIGVMLKTFLPVILLIFSRSQFNSSIVNLSELLVLEFNNFSIVLQASEYKQQQLLERLFLFFFGIIIFFNSYEVAILEDFFKDFFQIVLQFLFRHEGHLYQYVKFFILFLMFGSPFYASHSI